MHREQPNSAALASLTMLLVALSSCGSPMRQLGCLRNAHGSVLLFGNEPGALDGYDYRICTTDRTRRECTKYNQLTSERPTSLKVSLNGRFARVEQAGGSVFDYSTDPTGMRDSNFEHSIPLELSFLSSNPSLRSGIYFEVDGMKAYLTPC